MRVIYRYLVVASAILLLLTLVLVAWLYNRQATRELFNITAANNLTVDQILSNAVWDQYGEYFSRASEFDANELKARPETAGISDVVQTVTAGARILKVKIYSPDGIILFSTDQGEIGDDYSDSEAFQAAILEGRPSSELSFKHKFSAFSGEEFERDVVETYLPRFDAGERVVSVVEIYADVTNVKERIDATTWQVFAGLTLVFGAMYVVLVVGIMRRAIKPIQIASSRATQIGPDKSGLRLPTGDMPAEILPLVVAINDALDRLDCALDAQRRFTADAAHELLTPLALLRAQIDSLKDQEIAAPLRQDVDTMSELVSHLLYIAELEAQGQEPVIEDSDVHLVASEVISGMAPAALREDKALSLTGADGPVMVKGSPRMLSIAVRNLVDNAVKHTPENSMVEVNVGTDGTVRILDQGPGVPVELREKIFDRFWRRGARGDPGAGLGLSIVKSIADRVSATVSVEDRPGGGAVFVINFQLSAGQSAVDQAR